MKTGPLENQWAKGMEFNTSAVLIDAAEFSVARMPNRTGAMAAAAMFASLVKKTAAYTIIHATVQPTIGRVRATMLEDPACAVAIPSADCDTCPGPDALDRKFNEPKRSCNRSQRARYVRLPASENGFQSTVSRLKPTLPAYSCEFSPPCLCRRQNCIGCPVQATSSWTSRWAHWTPSRARTCRS